MSKPRVVLCRTCLRDNPGQGAFADFEKNFAGYGAAFKKGFFKKTAELAYQNCFAQCENFYCVQVTLGGWGYLLGKIDSPEKMQQVIDWVEEANSLGELKLPESLQEHVIAPVDFDNKKYLKP